MTQVDQDPAVRWSAHLAGLEGVRRDAVIASLRHSHATGWPASGRAVELLVSYAVGEITAQEYATGILQDLGMSAPETATVDVPPAPTSSYAAPPVERLPEPAAPTTIRREDAVQAYVTGRIPVGEFLRIARG